MIVAYSWREYQDPRPERVNGGCPQETDNFIRSVSEWLWRNYRDASDISELDNVIGNIARTNIPEGNARSSIRSGNTFAYDRTQQIEVFVSSAYLSSRHSPITGIGTVLESGINTPRNPPLYYFTIGWRAARKNSRGFIVRDFFPVPPSLHPLKARAHHR